MLLAKAKQAVHHAEHTSDKLRNNLRVGLGK